MDENFEYESNEEIEDNLEETEFEELPEKKVNIGKEIFEWCYTIAIALIIAIVVKAFVFDVVRVDGPSMLPTLHDNDRLIVTKLGYKPKQGDIIILDSTHEKRQTYIDKVEESNGHKLTLTENIKLKLSMPKSLKTKYYVKRVIALPGQTVDIIDGNVYIDGSKLEEPYFDGFTQRLDSGVSYPVTVQENHVFVMGDNRGNSTDSRSSMLGQVPYEAVFGKAQLRFWPLNSINILE
jgi:signal peptidase I